MKSLSKFRLKRGRWAVRLLIASGLALLFLAAWLGGFRSVTPARADPGTLYVDGASGSDTGDCQNATAPCQTIGYAISQAGSGDVIRVAQGTYTENPTIGVSVTLEGGYEPISWTRNIPQHETIIDGSGSTTQSVVTISPGGLDVALDGFTVTGGDKSGDAGGGGLSIWSDGSVILANSVITGNATTKDGGGIATYAGPSLTLQNVLIGNNRAGDPFGVGGGLYVRNGALATLTDVRVHGNRAAEGGGGIGVDDPGTSVVISKTQIYSNTALGAGGGGIAVNQGSLSLSNSSVLANSAPTSEGGGIHIGFGGSADVMDSIIADNLTEAHGGAVSTQGATVSLTNALITGNETTSGNANVLTVNESDVTVTNSTIAHNNPQGAQAVLLWSGSLTVTNSIMWNNALNLQGDPPCPACFAVTYSDIQGGWAGASNIDADPRFVGAAGGDFHLGVGSPCIDQGTTLGAPATDIEGTPRDAAPDMGAYEWTGSRIFLPLTVRSSIP